MASTQCSDKIVNLIDLSLGPFMQMAKKRGRGHWGHKGRPGKRGGSAPSKGSAPAKGGSVKGKPFEYYASRSGKRYEMEPEEAAEILGISSRDVEIDRHLEEVEWDWVSGGGGGEAKESIQAWYRSNPNVKELRLFGLYNKMGKEGQSFEEWKDSPVTMWRGGRPYFGDTFASFSLNKATAENFAKRGIGDLYEAKVKPNDWVGVTRGGEREVFVPEFNRAWDPIPYKRIADIPIR